MPNETHQTQPLSMLLFTELATQVDFGQYDDEQDVGEVQGTEVLSPVKHNQEN
ncbi:hypothetical protein [Deinococcus sp. YIM 77859]|uniref:hypothetical protein n=1 Tax=Deinococcus sp. YIM 77859 TaxID=1540221 RepID=UPI000AE0182C|nr:hypothetical protein [Deinococcus sp. YIM 77859]